MELLILAIVSFAYLAAVVNSLRHATDNADGLRSQEHTLSMYGVSWTTDPALERRMAADIRAAQRRRQTRDALAPSTVEQLVAIRQAEARRLFGANADQADLARFAREAALDLWTTEPHRTLADARQAENRLRAAFSQVTMSR